MSKRLERSRAKRVRRAIEEADATIAEHIVLVQRRLRDWHTLDIPNPGEMWAWDKPGYYIIPGTSMIGKRPWPQRHDPQAVARTSDILVETGLIALVVVLLLLAAVTFMAPAMLGR